MAPRLSRRACADNDEIAYAVARQSGSFDMPDQFFESIYKRFPLLEQSPLAGRRRDDLRPGFRVFAVDPYFVLYRVDGHDVLIQRVVRGSRDLHALFLE